MARGRRLVRSILIPHMESLVLLVLAPNSFLDEAMFAPSSIEYCLNDRIVLLMDTSIPSYSKQQQKSSPRFQFHHPLLLTLLFSVLHHFGVSRLVHFEKCAFSPI